MNENNDWDMWNFYFSHKNFKNYNKNLDKTYKENPELISYTEKVHAYFNAECSEIPLKDIIDNGGEPSLELMNIVNTIIKSSFLKNDSANNCAMRIKEYIDSPEY